MTPSPISPQLLIVGGPGSGKSTYRSQVFQRFEHNPGQLKLLKSVGDVSEIERDVHRVAQGLQPMHTSSNTYVTTNFSLADQFGGHYELKFADFDGEQLRRISNTNFLPAPWVERSKQADSWLFFLRIDNVRAVKGFMTHPVETGQRGEAKADETELPVSETLTEINSIELLQRLLFVRGTSLRERLRTPRLAVFLSCWDELPATERGVAPQDLLQTRAPLLTQFLKANWDSDYLKLWGLTSTEKSLPKEVPDKEFAKKGAETFGYFVDENGEQNRDLTAPICWLLQSR